MEHKRSGIEIKKIVKNLYGVNLDGYHELYLERRITNYFHKQGINTWSMIRDLIVNQPQITQELKKELQITYTKLYREPDFFKKIIQLANGISEKKGGVRIWHIGCSNGSEAYSLAILLAEEKLIDKCTIYATDINEKAIKEAKKGVLSIHHVRTAFGDYYKAGGKNHLSNYFNLIGDRALLKSFILQKIQFAKHELGQDHSFHEFDIIICRNMLIYYQDFHQQKLVNEIIKSLSKEGYLGLSNCESLESISYAPLKSMEGGHNIYQY